MPILFSGKLDAEDANTKIIALHIGSLHYLKLYFPKKSAKIGKRLEKVFHDQGRIYIGTSLKFDFFFFFAYNFRNYF